MAWDYAATERGAYPGYDDAAKNMPLPAGRKAILDRLLRLDFLSDFHHVEHEPLESISEILGNDGLHRFGEGGVIDACLTQVIFHPIQTATVIEDMCYREVVGANLVVECDLPSRQRPAATHAAHPAHGRQARRHRLLRHVKTHLGADQVATAVDGYRELLANAHEEMVEEMLLPIFDWSDYWPKRLAAEMLGLSTDDEYEWEELVEAFEAREGQDLSNQPERAE